MRKIIAAAVVALSALGFAGMTAASAGVTAAAPATYHVGAQPDTHYVE